MRNPQWKLLRQSLIQGGVPVWRVGRTIAEFQDHYFELEDEALRAGLNPDAAAADATARLGDISRLADEYLGHAELTTWWAKSPALQLCAAGGAALWQEQSGLAARWCFAAMTAAVFTATLLLVLHVTIVGL
jgi:hypothetical protein